MKKPMTVLIVAVFLMVAAGVASAHEFGTREQAEAMLERAIAVLKADKDRALDLFTSGNGGNPPQTNPNPQWGFHTR